MTEVKFTHGPWIAAQKYSSKSGLPIVASLSGRSIASVTFFGLGENFKSYDEESYANANLMAAGPDLYGAMQKIRTGLDLIDPANPFQYMQAMELMRKCADEALAKARGETHA